MIGPSEVGGNSARQAIVLVLVVVLVLGR